MPSGLIPGLNSVNWPEDEVSDQFQASLINLLDLPNQFLSSFVEAYPAKTNVSLFTHSQRQHWSELDLVLEWRTLALCVYVGILVPMALLAWLHYEEGKYGGDSVAPLAEESPETNAEAVISDSMHLLSDAVLSFSALFKGTGAGESVPESDVNHADDLQVQEPISNGEPSSSSSQSCFCRICLENKQTTQMYRNQICSHSFCHDCTSKHIAAKIQENIKTVLCPGEDCKAALDFDACRQIIPKEVIVQWDELLCKSMIPKSQIIYCPFRDCSAMLVNDSGEIIEEINCPACKRSICARCRVPWHVEFTCKEFRRLDGKKRGKENVLVEELAKKKSWRKCPECEIYVEKTEGCSHITCRCGHEFCYRCGLKWVKFHGGCNLAQGQGFNPPPPSPPHSLNWDFFDNVELHWYQSILLLCNYASAIKEAFRSSALHPSHYDVVINWCPPVVGKLKMNTDGSAKGDPGDGGFGGLIHDERGIWLIGYYGKLDVCTSLEAELWAIYRGLTIAFEKGYKDLTIETDSLSALELLKEGSVVSSSIRSLVEDSKFLMQRCGYTIQHVLREGNSSADGLAKLGATQAEPLVVLDEAPVEVRELVIADMVGRGYLRP